MAFFCHCSIPHCCPLYTLTLYLHIWMFTCKVGWVTGYAFACPSCLPVPLVLLPTLLYHAVCLGVDSSGLCPALYPFYTHFLIPSFIPTHFPSTLLLQIPLVQPPPFLVIHPYHSFLTFGCSLLCLYPHSALLCPRPYRFFCWMLSHW